MLGGREKGNWKSFRGKRFKTRFLLGEKYENRSQGQVKEEGEGVRTEVERLIQK